MKNLFLIVAAAVFIFSCSNSKNDKQSSAAPAETAVETNTSQSKIVHLTDETFKQKVFNYEVNTEWKYEGDVPCIVDFYADWCGTCKRVAPVLEELAKEYDGKIIIYKVDTDKQQAVAQAFGIRSIPSLLFVPVEGDPQMAQGALPKESFVSAINEVLLKQKDDAKS